ncbi:MAG: tetratricopeptide repeat protein [Woeseiaceae bacterium]
MPAFGLSLIVQIALIVHVLKTGRAYYWIFVIFLPGVGPLVYFIVELLPELLESRRGRSAVRGIRKTLDPGADLRQRQKEHKLSGSVDATRRLAGELLESGETEKAIAHYETALTGLYEHDPDLLLGLATAQFGNEQFDYARQTLDRLIEHNPDYRSPDGHLLYARSVEACGDGDKAREEYAALVEYYAGAEARVRYGAFLESQGDNALALNEYEEIMTAADLAPRHYLIAQKHWINEAKAGIKRLNAGTQ